PVAVCTRAAGRLARRCVGNGRTRFLHPLTVGDGRGGFVQASGSASRIPLAALGLWLLLLPACASSFSPSTSASRFGFNRLTATSTISDTTAAIRADISTGRAPAFVRLARADQVELAALYGVRSYSPLWIDAVGRPN